MPLPPRRRLGTAHAANFPPPPRLTGRPAAAVAAAVQMIDDDLESAPAEKAAGPEAEPDYELAGWRAVLVAILFFSLWAMLGGSPTGSICAVLAVVGLAVTHRPGSAMPRRTEIEAERDRRKRRFRLAAGIGLGLIGLLIASIVYHSIF